MTTPIVELGRRDRATLSAAARSLRHLDPSEQPEDFVVAATIWAGRLSASLRRTLINHRRFGTSAGAVVIRSLPLGTVPVTPCAVDPDRPVPSSAATAMTVLLSELGEPFGFLPELSGRLIQSIHPVPGFEHAQISLGSQTELDMHVETAFSSLRPDHVGLLCLRADHEKRAGTTIASVDSIVGSLDPAWIEVLRQPRFRTKVDASFRMGQCIDDEEWRGPISILSGEPNRLLIRVDFAETEACDDEARAALDALAVATISCRTELRLERGDLLVLNNRHALHGRTPFAPRYDGADRWLLRSFITTDLRRSAAVRPDDGRIIDPAQVAAPTV